MKNDKHWKVKKRSKGKKVYKTHTICQRIFLVGVVVIFIIYLFLCVFQVFCIECSLYLIIEAKLRQCQLSESFLLLTAGS